MKGTFGMKAGSAVREFTPKTPQFLYGYPHVPRISEGVHDPLLSSAFYLENHGVGLLFIANDIVYVPRPVAHAVRIRIHEATGLEPEHILISATHTHSGPKTMDTALHQNDPVIPPADTAFVTMFSDTLAEAGIAAVNSACPATLGTAMADSTGIGTHRHDPGGPSNHRVPVLAARATGDHRWIGWMTICSMHPTVLHEDSRLVSADFPWATRRTLQEQRLGTECAVLHHMGCAGNQSPRHVTRGNTFAEADRIGTLLGEALARAADTLVLHPDPRFKTARRFVDPPRKTFPDPDDAGKRLNRARQRLEALRRTGPATEARTAECDVFGAEHQYFLSRLAANGKLDHLYKACTPAEIQVFAIADQYFAGWPAEVYVEYALAVQKKYPKAHVISLANGTLSGYITTPEAARAGFYESGAAIFAPQTGALLVDQTLEIIQEMQKP